MRAILTALAIWALSQGAALAAGPQGFALHDAPRPLANIRFATEDGKRLTLDAFRGRVVLLNIWATWCPPCVKEMPTLDALQSKLGGPGFEVVALSIDRAGPEAVQAFFKRVGIENLKMYIDQTMLSATALRAFGLPTTLLIDAEGQEIGRLIGPAEWDDPEMVDFLKGYAQ